MSSTNAFDFFVQWHLTERCNLRCTHCYQTGIGHQELSLPEIVETLAEIEEMLGDWKESYAIDLSPSINVTGGEPFLHSDFFDILKAMGARGFALYVLTNGTLIDDQKAKVLSDLGVKGVQVSIEGPEAIHESIRGRGSFTASLKGIARLLDAGLKVTLNTTLSSVNAAHFMELIDLSLRLGVHRLGFSRLVPSGRGEAMLDTMLSTETVRGLYKRIFSQDTGGLEIVTGDPVAAQLTAQEQEGSNSSTPSGGCAAGISGITILPDGTLIPCRRLPVPLGNIKKDSLREIWATSEVLEALRDRSRYKGKCGACSRWAQCRGCRAIAYACSKAKGSEDLLAEDPQCFIGN